METIILGYIGFRWAVGNGGAEFYSGFHVLFHYSL